MEGLIDYIKKGTVTDKWENDKVGSFEDLMDNCTYHFLETVTDGSSYLLSKDKQKEQSPVACGFIAYLIKNWKKPTRDIFESYFEKSAEQYRQEHENNPDVCKRNLVDEYLSLAIDEEQKWRKMSETIFEYLPSNDCGSLRTYYESYIEYLGDKQGWFVNIEIPNIFKIHDIKLQDCESVNKNYYNYVRKHFIPINGVYILKKIKEKYEAVYRAKLFSEDVNLEQEKKEYINGFKKGYADFLKDTDHKIENCISLIFKNATHFYTKTWYPNKMTNDKKFLPYKWFDLGEAFGKHYCSWCLVLEHQDQFEPMFEQRYTQPKTKELPKKSQTDEEISIPDNLLNELEKEKLITKEPLTWNKKQGSALCAYFVDCYFSKNYPLNLWQIGERIFNVKNLRQAKYNYSGNKNGKPKRFEKVDKILGIK